MLVYATEGQIKNMGVSMRKFRLNIYRYKVSISNTICHLSLTTQNHYIYYDYNGYQIQYLKCSNILRRQQLGWFILIYPTLYEIIS
jgi:hypothetical protein